MAEEKTMENSGLGATGNFIHNYIQADLEGELNKIHTRVSRRNPMAICTLVTQNPFA